MRYWTGSALAMAGLMMAGHAMAHTPYLKPNLFTTPQRDHVTVEASFTEEFFVPDIVMKAEDYHVVNPAGAKLPVANLIYLRDLALFEVDLPVVGTYRLSTGERAGATRKMALVDGQWQSLRERDGSAPANATRVADAQSITRADVYVSKGPASDTALAPTGKGLEIVPLTHPNRLDAGGRLPVRVLFDGKPVAGGEIGLYRAGKEEEPAAKPVLVRTDAKGEAGFDLKETGTFLLLIRHRVEVAGTGPVAVKSHSTSVTFQVEG